MCAGRTGETSLLVLSDSLKALRTPNELIFEVVGSLWDR